MSILIEYPIQIGKEMYERYAQAGLHFEGFKEAKGHREAGFSEVEVTVDNNTLATNLAKLGPKTVYYLKPFLSDSKIGSAINKAETLWQLYRMDEKGASEYPFDYLKNQPATWELQNKIAPEVHTLTDKLKQQGIKEVRVGQELEFELPEPTR